MFNVSGVTIYFVCLHIFIVHRTSTVSFIKGSLGICDNNSVCIILCYFSRPIILIWHCVLYSYHLLVLLLIESPGIKLYKDS